MATIGLLKSKNTFTWRVKNFLKRPEKNGELILSPKFTIFDNYGRQFTSCLSLYPKGMLEYEGYVSVCVYNLEKEDMNLTCR